MGPLVDTMGQMSFFVWRMVVFQLSGFDCRAPKDHVNRKILMWYPIDGVEGVA